MTTMSKTNPVKVVIVITGLMLFLVAYFEPRIRQFLPRFPDTALSDFDEDAVDVLGQIDGTDTPYFTSAGFDNGPNIRGFGGTSISAIDTVRHRLFAADPNNNRVLVFNMDVTNIITDRVADFVLGQSNFKTNAVGTSAVTMSNPTGLAYDSAGDRLFVLDSTNNRVLVFDTAAISNGEAAVSVLGQSLLTTSGAPFPPTQSSLSTNGQSNMQLAYDAAGSRLFVTDTGNRRLLVFNVASITDGENAINVIGQADFVSADPTAGQMSISNATGVAYESSTQRLFISSNPRVMVFDVDPSVLIADTPATDGPNAINVIGQEDFSGAAEVATIDGVSAVRGVAVDGVGQRLFVNDDNRTTVYNINPAVLIPDNPGSNGPDAINVIGQTDFDSQTASKSQSRFEFANGLDYDPTTSMLYVGAESGRLMIFSVLAITNGEPAVNLVGQVDENEQPVYDFGGVNNSPNTQGFVNPYIIELDAVHHRLFVLDATNNLRLLVFDLDTDNELLDHTADAVIGQVDFKRSVSGTGANSIPDPNGLAYDPTNDRLFVSNGSNAHRVLVFEFNNAPITNGMSAAHVLGQPDFDTFTANTSQNGLNAPVALAFDDTRQLLFVADFFNNRIMVFDVDPVTIFNGQPASFVLGQNNFTSNSAGGDYVESPPWAFSALSGLAYDSDGQRLFASDSTNNRVVIYDVSSFLMGQLPINVLGQAGSNTSDPNTTIDGLSGPVGVEFDPTGKLLYVADANNNRVMVWDADAITDGEDAVELFGQADFVSAVTATTQSGFSYPSDMALTGSQLFVTDVNNNRVMIFEAAPATPTPTPTPTPAPTGGGGGGGPRPQGFTPMSIIIEDGDANADSKNVMVTVRAAMTDAVANANMPVNIALSNDPSFTAYLVFHETSAAAPGAIRLNDGRLEWKRTFPWDLCFGIGSCSTGRHIVYARFYVNVPAPAPDIDITGPGGAPVCKQRPACLNATPACSISVPVGGWCP